MSQIYYKSPSPTLSHPAPLTNGRLPLSAATASSSSSNAPRSASALYAQATRAFLARDFVKAASSIQTARAAQETASASSSSDEWFRLVQAGDDSSEAAQRLALDRKLAVLEITLLATAHSASSPGSAPSLDTTAYPSHFRILLEKTPKALLESIWASLLLPSADSPSASSASAAPEILASASAAFVHPSLATALSLAALKLDQPSLARSIIEAWLGSVSQEVDDLVAESAARMDVGAEFPVAGQGALGSSQVLRKPGEKKVDLGKGLVGSWVKLVDVLSLHVLPRLGEWEAAGDFVRMQAEENGGWIGQQRIDAALSQIEHVRQEQIRAEELRVQRAREAEAAKAAAVASRSSSKRRADKSKAKTNGIIPNGHDGSSTPPRLSPSNVNGNGRPAAGSRSTSATSSRASLHARSPPKTSPQLGHAPQSNGSARVTPSVEGFSGMRSALSRYLGRSHDTPQAATTTTTATRRGTLAGLAAHLQAHYAADPVKLLAFLHYLAREYPDPNYPIHQKLHSCFLAHVGKDEAALRQGIAKADFIKKELLAMYQLKRYRTLRARYDNVD